MTRKDYVLIADVLRGAVADVERDSDTTPLSERGSAVLAGERIALHMVAQRMADALRAGNSRFDHARFMAACGF